MGGGEGGGGPLCLVSFCHFFFVLSALGLKRLWVIFLLQLKKRIGRGLYFSSSPFGFFTYYLVFLVYKSLFLFTTFLQRFV